MGIVRMGIPEHIALFLKEKLNIDTFVETGTFRGGTAKWAANHFDKIHTIEFSEEIYKQTKNQLKSITSINFIYGDSRTELKNIINQLDQQQVLFWLDAHWCGLNSFGEEDQCPLIDELRTLTQCQQNHCILIDDARLFLAPPPEPNVIKYYPTIGEIIEVLEANQNKFTIVFEDVVFAIPKTIKEDVQQFFQGLTTANWKALGNQKNEPKSKKLKRLFKEILKTT